MTLNVLKLARSETKRPQTRDSAQTFYNSILQTEGESEARAGMPIPLCPAKHAMPTIAAMPLSACLT